MLRTRLAAVALATSTLAASGCGGSSNSAKPLTRAEMVARADVICRRVNAKRAATAVSSEREIPRIAPELAADEQTALAELRRLIPPASMANDWGQILADTQTLARNIVRMGNYVKVNRLSEMRKLAAATTATQQQMLAVARRDGFIDCAQPE